MNNLPLKNNFKYLIWSLFIIGSIISSIISYKFFPKAFPILDLKITTNRQEALGEAKKLATKFNFGPKEYQEAIYFTSNQEIQNYIELEAGGKDAWKKIIQEEKFSPYVWCIRHFQEGNPNETLMQFTTTGKPYGFDEQLSDNQPGILLTSVQAQAKAENFIKDWGIDLSKYKKIEGSQQKKISGRVDHTFVYELKDEKVGESHYRFNIVVSGDKVTKLHHFMNVPESFVRKFEELRSANNFLYDLANGIIYLVYVFIGCILTLIFFLRKRWLLIIPSLKWGLIISFAAEVSKISQLPLIWCSYNTAESSKAFLAQYILNLLISFFYYAIFYTIIFAAAEGLTRKAFPNKIQFFKNWTTPASYSYQILGRTIFSYLMIPFDFLFVLFFYSIGTNVFGWWNPSAPLVDPTILSTYAPWLAALGQSLNAGFWEECLFRAVPLSLGSIIGQHFGHRKTGIAISFVFQALVFGAAHANYPSLPWYVRLIELIIPSFTFGIIYLSLGLMTSIIIHYVYDAILFSLPIFISHGKGSLSNKIGVILGITFPLIFIFYNRLKHGKWINLPQEEYNKSWQPIAEKVSIKEEKKIEPIKTKISNIVIFLVISAIIFISSLYITRAKPDIEGLKINKEMATKKAKEVLDKNNIKIDDSWKIFTYVTNCSSNFRIMNPDKFIWQNAHEKYKDLIGNYLAPVLWQIRFAKFEGDIVSRAQEYNVFVESNSNVYRLQQQLPQSASGQKLDYQKAKDIAQNYIKERYQLDTNYLEEVLATNVDEPNRRDWFFEFIDRKVKDLADGQARIYLQVAGDKVVDNLQFIHEPENWVRQEQKKAQDKQTIGLISLILSIIIVLIAILFGVNSFIHGTFSIYYSILFSCIMMFILIINTVNNWPDIQIGYETTKSITNNIFMNLIKSAISYIKTILWVGLTAGIIYGHKKLYSKDTRILQIILAIGIGLTFSATLALIKNTTNANMPILPFISPANAFIPGLSFLLSYLFFYIEQTISVLFISSIAPWSMSISSILLMILIAVNVSGLYPMQSIIMWAGIVLLLSIIFTILYKYFLRYNTSIIPLITLIPACKGIYSNILYPTFVGSTLAGYISLVVITLLAFAWYMSLNKQSTSNN